MVEQEIHPANRILTRESHLGSIQLLDKIGKSQDSLAPASVHVQLLDTEKHQSHGAPFQSQSTIIKIVVIVKFIAHDL